MGAGIRLGGRQGTQVPAASAPTPEPRRNTLAVGVGPESKLRLKERAWRAGSEGSEMSGHELWEPRPQSSYPTSQLLPARVCMESKLSHRELKGVAGDPEGHQLPSPRGGGEKRTDGSKNSMRHTRYTRPADFWLRKGWVWEGRARRA